MYLFILVFLVEIGLAVWFAFISDAPVMAKIVVGALFIGSFFLHPSFFPMTGFFLRIALCIFVLFYQMCQTVKTQ